MEDRAVRVLQHVIRARQDPRPFLLPSNICEIVPTSLIAVGCPIQFVDIDERDLVMDRERCLSLLSHDREKFAGVVFVRTYGADTDEESFFARVKRVAPRTLLIDDKCLCRPDLSGEKLCPSADVTLFSTGYAKHVDLGGSGFGYLANAVAYVDDAHRAAGTWDEYRDRIAGALEQSDRHKQAINDIYFEGIPRSVQLPDIFQHWRFNIMVENSAQLVESLFAAGLFASRHYQPVSETFSNERAPIAEQLHSRIVNLFNDRYYTAAQARKTADIVRRHLDRMAGPTLSETRGRTR
jgi:dTDP-4-amino-4,6-dideoxygalactose transaminase